MENGFKLTRTPNCFGYQRFSPLTVFTPGKETLRKKIREDAVKYLFADKYQMFDEIARVATNELSNTTGRSIFDIELAVEHQIHYSQNHNGFIQNRLRERCFRIKDQLMAGIKDLALHFSPGDKLIDVGAGSGVVAQMLKDELELQYAFLTDVVDYRYPDVRHTRGMDFRLFKPPFEKIDCDELYQIGIITNTLHHCDEPLKVFSALADRLAPGAVLMVVESCVGVSVAEVRNHLQSMVIPYQTLFDQQGNIQDDQLEYFAMNNDDKMLYGIFFDWLYNRIFLNENINVPYNFGTPSDWNSHFENNGFQVLQTYLMGFDQPAAIEFHTLHIIKKK